ncbi:MAG: DNA-binding protein [Betaproteobacteria bacterium]|nr:MAG: DNA-binding protein [Betaproteobacteria bacterium]
MTALTPKPESLAQLVFFVRGERVMLDADLALLYGVATGALNRAVQRNVARFPDDFMFRLTADDWENLKCQIGISSSAERSPARNTLRSRIVTSISHGGRRGLPYAFTEQGVAMLSSVLRSPRAVEVNIAIMRTFVQLRRLMDSNRELARKIEAMEKKYDEKFAVVFDAIKQLIAEDESRKAQPKRRIGFS